MRRFSVLALIVALFFAFAACDESGPSMNEDYAGVWYKDDNPAADDGVSKIDLTDTTYFFLNRATSDADFIEDGRGTVTKTSDTTFDIVETHERIDGEMVKSDDTEPDETIFSLSSDGMTLTLGGEDWSSTDPGI